MDPSKIPDSDQLGAASAIWEWLVFLVGLVLTGGYAGVKVGKLESTVAGTKEDLAVAKKDIASVEQEIEDADYLPRKDFEAHSAQCDQKMANCQAHTWDRLLLALEKRDREFDNKFSAICAGISRVEQKVDNLAGK